MLSIVTRINFLFPVDLHGAVLPVHFVNEIKINKIHKALKLKFPLPRNLIIRLDYTNKFVLLSLFQEISD